jgi:hypothetical protein
MSARGRVVAAIEVHLFRVPIKSRDTSYKS